jgi:hypothetical protein
LDYYDVETVDQIVARIEQSGGKPSALLSGIIDSAPFQKTRLLPPAMAQAKSSTERITAAKVPSEKEKL